MGPELNREPADVQKLEQIISVAQVRSRNIRRITVGLLIGLIVFGAVLVFNLYRQREEALKRKAELQRTQQQAFETEAKLRMQAENSRKVSILLASGANNARYQKHWKEALADYDKALALEPDNSEALGLAGYLRFRTGDTQTAEQMLLKSTKLDPNNPWNHYNLALALWANGNKQDAIMQVEQVLKIDPSFKPIIAEDSQFKPFMADTNFKRLIKYEVP